MRKRELMKSQGLCCKTSHSRDAGIPSPRSFQPRGKTQTGDILLSIGWLSDNNSIGIRAAVDLREQLGRTLTRIELENVVRYEG